MKADVKKIGALISTNICVLCAMHGKTMKDVRKDVAALLNSPTLPYQVRVTADILNIRTGPSTSYDKVGVIKDKGVYTITKIKNNWGFLKSKAGWISLKYTERYKKD